MRVWTITGFALLALAGLGGCGEGGSAVETRDRATGAAAGATLTATAADGPSSDTGAMPEAAVLTANRRETVDDKVLRLYARNGEDFGARSAEDFLDKITAFTTRPPEGTETARRPNGDTLMYEAATNTFAVVARDGTPRTMFKPDDGAVYWAEQKVAAPTFGQSRPG
ncbi:S-type pyocin family protein [Brevundimonas sp. R86498]|uniref:S-type pyocin family protein n=1 Tax=Brevundimonas sp. R86498 TaxID=3093845 RepID=UPI0037C6D38F